MINKTKRYTPTSILAYNINKHNDIKVYNKISVVRAVSGVVCISIGIITTPIPMTTIPLIMTGGVLLGYDMKVLVPKAVYKAKCLSDWFYANRTPKRVMRTIKCRVMSWN